jgi:phosphonate transport system permease protein
MKDSAAVLGRQLWLGVALLLVLGLWNLGLLDGAKLARGVGNIGVFVAGMFPPNLSVLPTVARGMWETVQIAFVGTLLGVVLALPLALAANALLFGPLVTAPVRFVLAVVRTIPSLFWGIFFVVAIGLGPAAGTLGIALYSLGYMGKLLYETFEGVDPEVIEAVRSVGCDRWQLARYALIPEAANSVLAQVLFMFEYNVRASSIMGFVGAGGIGFYLLGYIQMLRYDQFMTALLLTLVVVIAIDQASALIRRQFLMPHAASTQTREPALIAAS